MKLKKYCMCISIIIFTNISYAMWDIEITMKILDSTPPFSAKRMASIMGLLIFLSCSKLH